MLKRSRRVGKFVFRVPGSSVEPVVVERIENQTQPRYKVCMHSTRTLVRVTSNDVSPPTRTFKLLKDVWKILLTRIH